MRLKFKFHNLLIFTSNLFYKIKIGKKSTLLYEINTIKSILRTEISDVLPQVKYSEKYLLYIKLEKLFHLEKDERFEVFEYFQEKLCKYDILEKTYLSDHQYISNAMNFFAEILAKDKSDKLLLIVNHILETPLLMGVVHGDLHMNNIMKNRNNCYKLIDFDCFSFYRIKSFDIIYYVIELLHLKNSLNWYLNFFKLLDQSEEVNWLEYEKYLSKIHGSFHYLLFLFFLDRFGQENIEKKISNETIYNLDQLVDKLIIKWDDTKNNL